MALDNLPLKNPSEIGNKLKRQDVFSKQKHLKTLIKKKLKVRRKKEEDKNPELREERLKKNVPKTLENTREIDETLVDPDDEEVMVDEQQDEFAAYFNQGIEPKVLITTSKKVHPITYELADELVSVIPNAEFVKRPVNYEIKHIVEFSKRRGYTDILIINEDHKVPNALAMIHLPEGPTAYFKLTNYVKGSEIHNHGRATAHQPELILNNFNTRLGRTVGRFFAALFPHVPEFQGRQAATFHNQRDFIFFRRHRYMFKDGKRVALQEIGPRFTLKLQWLQKGTYDTKQGEFEWIRKPELETSRRKFFL